jgi:hypothetical protein
MTTSVALLALLIASGAVTTTGIALISDWRNSAGTVADRVSRLLSRSPGWIRSDQGSYDRTAVRWWGLALVAAGSLPVLGVVAGLADNGRGGAAHGLLILPLGGLFTMIVAIGILSASYRSAHPSLEPPFISIAVSAAAFGLVLLAGILTHSLGYL